MPAIALGSGRALAADETGFFKKHGTTLDAVSYKYLPSALQPEQLKKLILVGSPELAK